jgi:hypothetical protein
VSGSRTLERENRELRQANEILRKASAYFCPGGARPPAEAMIAFIDDHRARYGVEPICRVLPIAPSTYRAHVAQRRDPTKASMRAKRDARLRTEIRRVFEVTSGFMACAKSGASSAARAHRWLACFQDGTRELRPGCPGAGTA